MEIEYKEGKNLTVEQAAKILQNISKEDGGPCAVEFIDNQDIGKSMGLIKMDLYVVLSFLVTSLEDAGVDAIKIMAQSHAVFKMDFRKGVIDEFIRFRESLGIGGKCDVVSAAKKAAIKKENLNLDPDDLH